MKLKLRDKRNFCQCENSGSIPKRWNSDIMAWKCAACRRPRISSPKPPEFRMPFNPMCCLCGAHPTTGSVKPQWCNIDVAFMVADWVCSGPNPISACAHCMLEHDWYFGLESHRDILMDPETVARAYDPDC